MTRRLMAIAAACLALAGLRASPPPADAPYQYVVRPGDTLYSLASAYFAHPSDARTVRLLNHVRRADRLRIGSTLQLPRPILRTTPLQARVLAFRGMVTADARPVTRNAALPEGTLIETGAGAFVSLVLADGTTVTLPSASRIRISRLRRILISGETDRAFALERGRTQLSVTPRRNPGDRFEIGTPLSVAAVRGTGFRVALLDGGAASATEVLEGVVAVTGAGADAAVAAGTGIRATAQALGTPVQLLPAPKLDDPGADQAQPTLRFVLLPEAGAQRYRAQVATDAGFLDIVAEGTAAGPQVPLPAIPNGDWFVRVTAIDAAGLEGLPRVYSFQRFLNGVRADGGAMPGGHRYMFKWLDLDGGRHLYRFQLVRADAPDRPIVDEPGIAGHGFVVTQLPPGDYSWRVETSSIGDGRLHATWSSPQTLTVAPPHK